MFYHDFDNDGDIDIVTKTNADGKVQYHEQINGNFNSTNYLDPGRMLMNDIQIIDVNNDGHEDLIANGVNNATNGGTSLAILLDNSGNYIDDYVLHDNVPGVLQDKYFFDINNDGKLDVIYATYNNLVLAYGTSNPGEYLITDSLNVTLYTSNPNSWTQGGIGLMNNSDEAMQVLDIDNDGDLDIVLIDRTPRILLFENQGNNTFQQRLLSASTISAYEMGDLDGDGDIDLVFGNFISSNQSDVRSWLFDHTTKQIVLNQRDTVNANLASPSFDLVDADTDGDLDIVYGGLNWQENTNGLGAFADDTLLISSPSATPLQINSGDFNNDGLIDLFHSVTSPPSIRVITNQGTSYSATDILATAPSSSNTNANSVYDLDNDGIDDIIYTSIDGYYQPYWLKVCFTQFDTNNVSACKSYTWIDGNTYNSSVSGINYTATNSLGCDTVFTLNLTIDTVDTRVSRSGITLTALNTSLIGANFQWVDCNNNFAPINGATSNTFTPNGNGSYAVAISDPNNSICSDTSSCFLVNSVGNRESHQLKNVTIYPNPSLSGLVQIEIGDLHKNLNYKVVNSIGQIVDSEIIVEQSTQIELPKETGLYHIEIFNQEGLRNTYKIIRR